MQNKIKKLFSEVQDPRVEGRCLHLLKDILFISFCTLLSNGEDYEDMVEFAEQRREWLEEILDLPNGIPSHDTFNRVLQLTDPQSLTVCLTKDGQELIDSVKDKLINFDGKKIRGVSPRSRGNKGLFILSAWVSENRLCLGQQKVEDKSNEITAIPQLMDLLDLQGSTVTIDAIGCQTEIAEKIITKEANYLLSVKKNQKSLYEEVSDEYLWQTHSESDETWEYGHGRYETRRCRTVDAAEFLSPDLLSKWKGVRTLVRVDSSRRVEGVTSSQSRFYISSDQKAPSFYNNAAREHWGIENHLHWHLDVTFNEDANRSRSGNAPQNLNILRKIGLQRISRMDDKLSLKKRRFRASMNVDYLQDIVGL